MMDGNNYEKLCGIGDKAEVREISEYVGTICGQIRWKKARRLVAQEIGAHIEDQRDAYLAEGLSEGAAARRAVESMGDPVAVGASLDRVHRPKPQYLMAAAALIMLACGVAMRHVASAVAGGSGISGYSLKSNLLGAFFAGGLFLILYFVDFSWLQKHAGKFFLSAAAAAAVLKYCLLSGHGHGPESAWGDFFGYGFLEGLYQCMALLCPAVFALLVYRMRGRGLGGIFLCEMACLMMVCCLDCTNAGMIVMLAASACTICYAAWQGWFRVGRNAGIAGIAAAALPVLQAADCFSG